MTNSDNKICPCDIDINCKLPIADLKVTLTDLKVTLKYLEVTVTYVEVTVMNIIFEVTDLKDLKSQWQILK